MIDSLQSAFGLMVFIVVCALFSRNRQAISPILVIKSLCVQLAFALILLKFPASHYLFVLLNDAIGALQEGTQAGTSFIFGFLGGAPLPFEETYPGGSFVMAFRVLPMIIVVSVLSGLLVYWRVLPLVMNGMSWLLEKTLGIGGALGLAISSNAFLGMVESPLLIKPYLSKLSNSELFSVMTAGMATIAGSMLAIEAAVIGDAIPNAVGHLLSASLITLPGIVYISHLLVPNTEPVTSGNSDIDPGGTSVMDVIATSTHNGLQVFLNVIAMVIVIVALVHLLNAGLGLFPDVFNAPLSVERLLGYVMAPVTWLLGIPWSETIQAGKLMGIKTALTEFVAYVRFGELPVDALSMRSKIIMTYALCGFANFISLGIMITGLVIMVPARRDEIINLGVKSIAAGTVATCTTACIIGVIL